MLAILKEKHIMYKTICNILNDSCFRSVIRSRFRQISRYPIHGLGKYFKSYTQPLKKGPSCEKSERPNLI